MPFLLLLGAVLSVLTAPLTAQQPIGARAVVQSAERAVADDSVATVTARWLAALERDSTDRVAPLGLGTLARLTYDFAAAERLFAGILARSGSKSDEWTVQARIGLYRVTLAQGDNRRADSLLIMAQREARRIGDRGGQIDALIGLSGTRASRGPSRPGLATLDSLGRLLPAGDSWERGEYLCRLGLFRGVGGDSGAARLVRDGVHMAERLGERQLAGHCLEAYALVHSVQGRADSVFPIMARAETLLRATRAHASLARLYPAGATSCRRAACWARRRSRWRRCSPKRLFRATGSAQPSPTPASACWHSGSVTSPRRVPSSSTRRRSTIRSAWRKAP